jgi:hypothetical protein
MSSEVIAVETKEESDIDIDSIPLQVNTTTDIADATVPGQHTEKIKNTLNILNGRDTDEKICHELKELGYTKQ